MKYTFVLVTLLLACFSPVIISAQQKPRTASKCGVDLYLESAFANYPGYKEAIRRANQQLMTQTRERMLRSLSPDLQQQRANSTYNIAVVFHLVLPDASSVTDEEIRFQLDVLNRDFGGQNADSTNLSPMFPYSLRGHSGIRFCLAGKDESGNPTTGVERRCSNTQSTAADNDPVKRSAAGGLDAWDPSRYFNVWITNSSVGGLLGYSTYPFSFPGYTSPALEFQGVVISRAGFGNAISSYAFNRGRTLVHETGHFFGLFHIFDGGCNSADFSKSTFDGSGIDDTPAQANFTGSGNSNGTGCPRGKLASGCSISPDSGRLYQDFMDYTDDPCLTLFTVNQALRMEAAIDFFRPTLKMSDACQAPILLNNNAAVLEVRQPYGGRGAVFTGCSTADVSNVYCTGVVPYRVTPSLRLGNTGANAIGEIEVWYRVDEQPAILNSKYVFTKGLVSMADTLLTLTPVSLGAGEHVLRFFTRVPNGITDSKPDNDTVSANIFIDLPSAAPITEGFEGPLFPPAGWRNISPNGDHFGWERTKLAKNTGSASAFINLYNYDTPGEDLLLSPAIDIRNADSILLNFLRAYRQFSLTPDNFIDTLEVLISEDCGTSFKSVWKKGGAQLATNPGPTGYIDWYPDVSDWLSTTFDLKPFVSAGAGSLHVAFRAKNGYGQNIFLDDINIKAFVKPQRDVVMKQVSEPLVRLCSRSFTPRFLVSNAGTDTLRSLNIRFSVDGGAVTSQAWTGVLASGQSTTIVFAVQNLPTGGMHQLSVYSADPNHSPDQNTGNDSLSFSFNVFDPVNAPVNEGFESPLFAPAHWYVMPSAAPYNWERTTRTSSEGIASAWMKNRRFNGNGATADLYSPLIQISGADSVFARFDVSYAALTYSSGTASSTDTLEVLFTKDCGQTFTSVYKKWGKQLQTVAEGYPYASGDTTGFIPVNAGQWRMDSINLTSLAGSSGSFQLAFRNTNNNGNNIFLDNIRINQVILPAKLKREGYLVIPNPSRGLFIVQHYLQPVNLKAIQVFNTGGQRVWEKRFNGDAVSLIPVDLSNIQNGVYVLRLQYTDRTVTQRIIKIK